MKILMLLDSEFPHDERVEKEAQSLISLGYEVAILSYGQGISKKENWFNGIQLFRIPMPLFIRKKLDPFHARIPIISIFWFYYTIRLMRKYNFNCIHVHDLPLCHVGFNLKRVYKNIKYVADMHENYPALVKTKRFMKKKWMVPLVNIPSWYNKERIWLSNADLIISTASGMKKRLKLYPELRKKEIIVIENTIRISDFKIPNLKPDPQFTTLFYSGGITEHRGLQIALKGYHKVKLTNPKLRFWIVGSGSYQKRLVELINKLEIKDITFWGWKEQSEMFKLMAQSDICLIPHLKSEHTDNTSPNKIFHYFYAKKPVIVSNCEFLKEIVQKTNTGIFYLHNDFEDFASKLTEMVNRRDLEKLSNAAIQAAETTYNWTTTARKLIESYNCLTKRI